MNKVSVVISAYNAEKTIEKVLSSIKWADEIIVVNCSSTDKTVEITKRYTSKIFTQPNHPMLNKNKNFGFTKAKNEWILSIDSDEEVSEDLAAEIQQVTEENPKENGFLIPRKNIIFGKWIEHAGWYPDHQLRLFRKGKGKFEEEHVHELVKTEGEAPHLKNHIIHHNYQSINQFIEKINNIYAQNEAENLLKQGYVFTWTDAIKMPLNEFLSRFFQRKGYKDGFHGLMLSILMAFYHFIIFALIWEKENFKEPQGENMLTFTEKELKKANKDISFWFTHEKLIGVRNPIKKIFIKIFNNLF